jgi:photosystem II stability/assembly factor-like uncharacterized protein
MMADIKEWLKTDTAKILLRAWVAGMALITFWGVLNVWMIYRYEMGAPRQYDVAWGIIVIIYQAYILKEFSTDKINLAVRWIAFITSLLAIGVGIGYLQTEGGLRELAYLANQANQQFSLLVYSIQTRSSQIVVELTKLILLWGLLTLISEVIGFSLLLILDIAKLILKALRKASSKVRWGRVFYWSTRIMTGFVSVFVVWAFLPTFFAYNVPPINYQTAYIPYYPSIKTLTLNQSNNTLLAGTDRGLFKSNDNGSTWVREQGQLSTGSISLISANHNNGLLFIIQNGNLYKSIDNGQLQGVDSVKSNDSYISELTFSDKQNQLFVSVNSKIYQSNDLGETWNEIASSTYQPTKITFNSTNRKLYIGESLSFQEFRSGFSLEKITMPCVEFFLPNDDDGSWKLATSLEEYCASVNDLLYISSLDIIYAATNYGLYRTANEGLSWEMVNLKVSVPPINVLQFDETKNILYAGSDRLGVFVADIHEDNWRNVNSNLGSLQIQSLYIHPVTDILYAGTASGGLYRKDGKDADWQISSDGLKENYIEDLIVDQTSGELYANTNSQQPFSLNRDEISWSRSTYTQMKKDLYTPPSSWRPIIMKTSDRGKTWSSANVIPIQENTFDNYYDLVKTQLKLQPVKHSVSGSMEIYSYFDNNATEIGIVKDKYYLMTISPNLLVRKSTLDNSSNIIYFAMYDYFIRSFDNGTTWTRVKSPVENAQITSLAYTSSRMGICAGVADYGVYCSADDGETWKVLHRYTSDIKDMLYVASNRVLYVASANGIYMFNEETALLEAVYVLDAPIVDLEYDFVQGILYAGTANGLKYSKNDGQTWETATGYVPSIPIRDVYYEKGLNKLFAVTAYGVYLSTDNGASWNNYSLGLPPQNIQDWIYSSPRETFFVISGMTDDVYQSTDHSLLWEETNKPTNDRVGIISEFRYDETKDVLYSKSYDGKVYSLNKNTKKWSPASAINYPRKEFRGSIAYVGGLKILIASDDLASYITQKNLRIPYVVLRESESDYQYIVGANGSSFFVQEFPDNVVFFSGSQIIASAWMNFLLKEWFDEYGKMYLAICCASLVFLWMTRRLSIMRRFGVAFSDYTVPNSEIQLHVSPLALSHAWTEWGQMLDEEIKRFGNVFLYDLYNIPVEFRQYTIDRYFEEYSSKLLLEKRKRGLYLLTGDRLKKWNSSWQVVQREVGARSGLMSDGKAAVNTLANVLCGLLGFNLKELRELNNALAFQVEAPILRMRLPSRFPLIFIADQQPSENTVQNLVDVVDLYQSNSYFALVVVLESANRALDLPSELRRLVSHSPHAKDFIILSNEDVINILISRNPVQELAQSIAKQVDLSFISPFVIAGPVPENMFFGREAEIRNILDGFERGNFALVGNRKVGKTSLLKRVVDKLQDNPKFQPLWMDCQTVRNAEGFYELFTTETGIQVEDPSAFSNAVNQMKRQGRTPVFILDEVDALLWEQKTKSEILPANWRALAQADVCRFVFCGSTGLARFLDDSASPMFNFPQSLPLGYLNRETTDFLISQPFETLGVGFTERSAVLDAVWNLTSGHPNLVQYVGNALVQIANKRDDRTVSAEDVQQLDQSDVFTNYFLTTLWGEIGSLEKIITLIASSDETTLSQIEAEFQRLGISVSDEALDTSMKMLRVYSLMQKVNRAYQFIPRAFPEILHRTQDVERLIRIEKAKYMEKS